ncbi:hypothetical protein VHUM_00627 [Vanrija humicola]|uniref:Uncharacterized protein n=1 Tax=Vanrija humicola TaxID=5417 RepID=A0A7D8V1R9_VANHU|nr:hypothetical protein VHUM_00627 [Vanrija humicola]
MAVHPLRDSRAAAHPRLRAARHDGPGWRYREQRRRDSDDARG